METFANSLYTLVYILYPQEGNLSITKVHESHSRSRSRHSSRMRLRRQVVRFLEKVAADAHQEPTLQHSRLIRH